MSLYATLGVLTLNTRNIAIQKQKPLSLGVRIPVDTRSPIPVISVQSVGDLQYRRQS